MIKIKIIDLIDYPKNIFGHSNTLKIFDRYSDKEVVTSYVKNDFGIMFLISGKVKGFAFAVLKRDLCYSHYNTEQITPQKYFQIRAEIKDKSSIHILNEQAEDKIKAKSMLEELKTTKW